MPRVQVSIQLLAYWKINQGDDMYECSFGVSQGCGHDTGIGFWLIIVGTTLIAVQLLHKVSGWKRAWEFWQIFAGMIVIMQMTIARVFDTIKNRRYYWYWDVN